MNNREFDEMVMGNWMKEVGKFIASQMGLEALDQQQLGQGQQTTAPTTPKTVTVPEVWRGIGAGGSYCPNCYFCGTTNQFKFSTPGQICKTPDDLRDTRIVCACCGIHRTIGEQMPIADGAVMGKEVAKFLSGSTNIKVPDPNTTPQKYFKNLRTLTGMIAVETDSEGVPLDYRPLSPVEAMMQDLNEYPKWRNGFKATTPPTEADKPEGTRDVDKYLKEQQNKLWEGMV